MEQIKKLYYELFVRFVVEVYSAKIKQAKAGHCMKITGLAMKELKSLLPLLRPINPSVLIYILSEDEKGADFIHATKLIELRNDPSKAVLILVPSNSKTSAEDSYGDATFQNLNVADLEYAFCAKLIDAIPANNVSLWQILSEILIQAIDPSMSDIINYMLYLHLSSYSTESWGNGLFIFGMLPDSDLVKEESNIRRRFMINYEKVSAVLGDLSITAADRIASLPLQRNSIQKQLMSFLIEEDKVVDRHSLFEAIHDKYPQFNYAALPWVGLSSSGPVKVSVELVVGKDPLKELVKDSSGDYILAIPKDRKSKVSFTIKTDPSPKDNPDICFFEIVLINIDDFSEVEVLKRAKVGTNKRAQRKLSVNIANGMFADGDYMLCVRILDNNKLPLATKQEFKEDRVQMAWEEAKAKNPNLSIEQYRLENRVAYCYESSVFIISNTSDDGLEWESNIDKRTKVNNITQAVIHYRSSHLSKGESLDIEYNDDNTWEDGTLNNTYKFDFGPSYAYQVQLPKKLIQLEKAFLTHDDKFGCVEAFLSGNPTDATLLDPNDTAKRHPRFVAAENLNFPEELLKLRHELFSQIKKSAENESGLCCTFNFTKHISLVKDYISQYDQWLREQLEKEISDKEVLNIQNLDTVMLWVEMPDGNKTTMKLITPLHPLRLLWMINLYELYQDWEEKTLQNPALYNKSWYRKLDKLFQGELPMDIAPLVLTESPLKEAYQYIGELTFGWGAYAQPSFSQNDAFASGYRQLKSYAATLLNVTKDKRVDSDVSLALVTRHIFNYALSHPYTDKLTINLFNAGDAAVFASALVLLEKLEIGCDLKYEIRLFSDDNMLQSGEAFKEMLDPESNVAENAEVFYQAATNRLFPKLRFSLNKLSDFINNHHEYQAHLSFLVNPFAVHTELVRADELSRSFYLNGTICRNVIIASEEGKSFIWNRYFSNKTLSNPISEFANLEVSIFSRLQDATGRLLSTTLVESIPATTLRLKESDMMLISFVHDASDWVITFDKNMGPEFYDLPCLGENDVPYLLDYIPGEESTGLSSFLTTKPTSEIGALMVPLFKDYGIDLESKENFDEILEDIRSVSSSLIMQVNATSRKGFEVIGTTLTKRFLQKKGIMKESFLIPIDLHKELFKDLESDSKQRADNVVVKINTEKKEILFNVVEIKCRNTAYNPDELHVKILNQINNTIEALKEHFEMAPDGADRLDRELKTLELKSLLEFYIRRSLRYGHISPDVAHNYLLFLSKLSDGYTLRFKHLGVIFSFCQQERQKKDFYGDAVIYTMGKPVIDEILDPESNLETAVLEALDHEFINFFEPTIVPEVSYSPAPINTPSIEEEEEPKEIVSETSTPDEDAHIMKATAEEDNQEAEQSEESDVVSEDADRHEEDSPASSQSSTANEDAEIITNSTDSPTDENRAEEEDPNYIEPKYDVIIGKNGDSPQYGIIGKAVSNGRIIGLDLNECNTVSLFGVQGAGKSYTIGSVTEMVLRQFSKVNKLPAPMASVIFHYSDSMDYAPEFTSMVYPNDEAGQLAKLKAEYGAEPGSIKDVILLAPESQVNQRKSEYPNIEVHPIGFDSAELSVKDWMFLLGAVGNDSTYIKELKQIMKACRYNMSLQNIRNGVANSSFLSTSQRSLAEQKLTFAEEYITDGKKLQQFLCPGRLIIVDLRDEFIEKDEALGLFVVMLNIFSGVMNVNGKAFNKFIVFDEAHKYMNNKDLVGSITTAIREMRHKGVSIMIASQDPMSLPTEIIELSSIVVMHRFSSPAWVKHVQKAITPLQTLTPTEMSALGSGEAFLWANKSTDKSITQRPVKISIRPRVTKHGGDTIQAVK